MASPQALEIIQGWEQNGTLYTAHNRLQQNVGKIWFGHLLPQIIALYQDGFTYKEIFEHLQGQGQLPAFFKLSQFYAWTGKMKLSAILADVLAKPAAVVTEAAKKVAGAVKPAAASQPAASAAGTARNFGGQGPLKAAVSAVTQAFQRPSAPAPAAEPAASSAAGDPLLFTYPGGTIKLRDPLTAYVDVNDPNHGKLSQDMVYAGNSLAIDRIGYQVLLLDPAIAAQYDEGMRDVKDLQPLGADDPRNPFPGCSWLLYDPQDPASPVYTAKGQLIPLELEPYNVKSGIPGTFKKKNLPANQTPAAVWGQEMARILKGHSFRGIYFNLQRINKVD